MADETISDTTLAEGNLPTESKGADTTATETKAAEIASETKAAETTEAKPAAETKDGETKAEAPADYTTLKLPEGYKADDPVFADAVKLFEGEKISPAQAQKLLDFTVERDKAMVKAVQDQSAAQWAKQTDEWKTTAAKEFDEAALGDAKTALAQVFDKETVTYLESMGFTNHPGLIRGMVKVSKAIKDDTWVSGNAGQVNGSDARKAFPNSNMNP